jgi:DegV family protein with EDD domain
MPKIQIVTDSDSSLSSEIASANNILQVPITIQFGEESLICGDEINDVQLFEKIDKIGKLPTTAAPSPSAFAEKFRLAFEKGADSIICICVGSKISRTYDSAVIAAEEFTGKKITVIDSEYVSMGQGFMALAAAEAVEAGASHEEVVKIVNDMRPRLSLFGSLTTLKYLAMGGRVGTLAAGVANIMDIRPILTMRGGKLDLLEKVRTRKASMDRLVELVLGSVEGKPVERAAIIHVNNLPDATVLESRLREGGKMPPKIMMVEFTPGLSVHTGAGMIGAIMLVKE